MIISKTPLRISFAGGGTDLPSYYSDNDYGAVLSASINSYLYVTIKEQSSLYGGEYRLNYSETEIVEDINDIKNSIIRESIKFMDIQEKLYIGTTSDVPASTGLGSSSSFCVGLLNALYKFKSQTVSSARLAEEATFIECNLLKRPMGKQDQYAAAFGGINYIRFYTDESVVIKPINMNSEYLKNFHESIMMFWTGITRPSESVLAEQDKNNSSNVGILDLMKDQAQELSNVLVKENFSVKDLGVLMDEGWNYKKQLASNISNKDIDDYYESAKNCGALGGKISGAGGGGFLLIVSEKKHQNKIIEEMSKKGLSQYSFGLDSLGSVVYEIE